MLNRLCIVFLFFITTWYSVNASQIRDLDQAIGQLFMIGFQGNTPTQQRVIQLQKAIHAGLIGGVILYAENIVSKTQLQGLNQSLLAAAPSNTPLWIGIDEEGGRVSRLTKDKGFPTYLSPSKTAQTLTWNAAYSQYDEMARLLKSLGISVNFGTVLDLNSNPDSPIIGGLGRSYSESAITVAAYGYLINHAHLSNGVLPVAKHFPGHGSAHVDSHHALPDVTTSWKAQELRPFIALSRMNRLPAIMSAHLKHPYSPNQPASLSKSVLHRLLRKKHRYNGLLFSDDLNMGAIAKHYTLEAAIIAALQAGTDILIIASQNGYDPHLPKRLNTWVKTAINNKQLDERSIVARANRIVAIKRQLNAQ